MWIIWPDKHEIRPGQNFEEWHLRRRGRMVRRKQQTALMSFRLQLAGVIDSWIDSLHPSLHIRPIQAQRSSGSIFLHLSHLSLTHEITVITCRPS